MYKKQIPFWNSSARQRLLIKWLLDQSDRADRQDVGAGQQLLQHRNSTAVLISTGELLISERLLDQKSPYPGPNGYPTRPSPSSLSIIGYCVAQNITYYPIFRVYLTFPVNPNISYTWNTWRVNKVPTPKIPDQRFQHIYPSATRLFFLQFLARTCPILKNSNYWALFLPAYYISNTCDKSKNDYFRYFCSQHRQYSCLTNVPKWSFEEYMHPINSNLSSIYLCKSRSPGLLNVNKTDLMCVWCLRTHRVHIPFMQILRSANTGLSNDWIRTGVKITSINCWCIYFIR